MSENEKIKIESPENPELVKSEKKGGPYSKVEQEKNKDKVYELFFEKGCTVVKIAEKIGIHRNTVSEYVRQWTSSIASQYGEKNVSSVLVKQLESMRIQRQTLLLELEDQDDLDKILRIQKLLFEMDQKMTSFVLKIAEKHIDINGFKIPYGISEEDVKLLVMSMSAESRKRESKKGLLQRIIHLKKCNVDYAESMFNYMQQLGLDLFELPHHYSDDGTPYNITSFASHRGYI